MWTSHSFKRSSFLSRIIGSVETTNRFPLLNYVTTVYIGVVLFTYLLFMIAPFTTVLAKTPLYHISAYLGLLGALLLAVDLFTNKVLWRGSACILLYGLCAVACLSSVRLISYGLHDNLFDICWIVIQFALVYSWAYRLEKLQRARFFGILYIVSLGIWFLACCVSLYQFAFNIGYRYIADPRSINPELTRQGFLQHRLFGLFTGLDYAVYVSLVLIIVGVYYFARQKNLWHRIALGFAMFVLLMHIILSGSRSVQISLFLYAFFYTLLRLRQRIMKPTLLSSVKLMAVSLGAVLLLGVCFFGLKTVAQYVPSWLGVEISEDEDIFDREEDLEGNVSNNRFAIWGDYLKLYREIGLVGLSPSNYNDYISDQHSDLYIVQYFQTDYGDTEKTDMVYESHNNYLFVFVCTGFVGLLLFLSFFVYCLVLVLRYILEHRKLPLSYIAALAVVCVGLVEALFMNSVFLKINAVSFFFWFALGYLLRETTMQRPAH